MSKEGIERVVTSMVTSLPDRIMLFLDGVVPLHGLGDLDDADRSALLGAARQIQKDFLEYSFKDGHVLDDAFSAFARRVQGYIEDRYRE